ncbi:Acyl transferase/acyl hydrolase/lysophospholipase [Penicillium cf. griseofulvum]|uniref:Acyl transferase/acyl hydrolase/lysophospholipase n=1 Tax=Penicillium cf. griseofulvum TaxID=2972120 RepID=A0A9W9M1D1_9EURO|nr:Acyl transferase/acyl hydrolase/lysophospholipase [Penicillium cf. griseofulvum]KAJ5429723.1 Acyl transferase/acyl hydrolase/lysophospholipase [Penicillium cf. griseofulvum]
MRLQPPSSTGTPVIESANASLYEQPNEITDNATGDVSKRTAIIGMSCRLPGDVSTAEDFWDLCSRGRSAWSPIPKSRFNADSFYHPHPDRPGSFNPVGAHFLKEDIALFDAPFFNITLQEARSMDPQQRIFLECVYEALENAGIPTHEISGQKVGVFAGASYPDYEINNTRDISAIPMYAATGTAMALQANRISYYFDLNGPSVTVDTACSSSLSALHLASQSIRNGECSMAIVGGCHLNITPEAFVSMTRSRLLADTGRSYAFDHRGTGFGRGEGAGCIILKSLEDAEAAGDAIRSVIINTGLNQDGRTRGIAMPNGEAQEALIRQVYKEARIDPSLTGFVEAHGTGTKVGDPLEATALNAVFGKGRTPRQPLLVGSVKSNIGHTEGTSGIVSVIKTALGLERGFVPPNCNFEMANDEIPMGKWNMKVPKKLTPWPRGKPYASVNNFGFGGTNAHVILQRGPRHEGDLAANNDPLKRKLYVLSAYDKQAALQLGKSIAAYLDLYPVVFNDSTLDNMAYTLGQRRTFLPWRLASSAILGQELTASLSIDAVPVRSSKEPTVGFVFTGQGAQWHGMGKELLSTYPVFQRTMKEVDSCLKSLGATFSIIDELLLTDPSASSISAAYMSQPACTAVQLALVDLLSSWGIRPKAVVGHSSGEIAAAYAAGILSLDECVRVAYSRGVAANLVANDKSIKGGMLAVGAGASDIQQILNVMRGNKAVIACVNSESSVTLSGDADVIADLQIALDKEGIFTRRLQVEVAYHSHHMKTVSHEYRCLLGKIAPRDSEVPFYSTVYGKLVPGSALDGNYWVDNLVSRVEFVEGLKNLVTDEQANAPINTLIEIGPHPALQTPVKEIAQKYAPGSNVQYLHTLKRKVDDIEAVQNLAGSLFTHGMNLDFQAINFPNLKTTTRKPAVLTNLPKYPWNHSERYWFSSRLGDNHFHRQFPRSDILGSLCIENVDFEPRWRNIIRADDHPWIREHKVHGRSVYPMTGFLTMAIEAISQHAQLHHVAPGKVDLRDIFINRVLTIPENSSVETMLSLKPSRAEAPSKSVLGWHEFKVFSWAEGRGWDQHCNGFIMVHEAKDINPVDGSRQQLELTARFTQQVLNMRNSCSVPVDSNVLYENINSGGINYGPLFQGLTDISMSRDRQAMATIRIPDTKAAMPHGHETPCIVHPVTLDLCSQLMWVLGGFAEPGPHITHVPSYVKQVTISLCQELIAGTVLQVYGNKSGSESVSNPETNRMFATVPSNPANLLIEISGITLVPISNDIKSSKDTSPGQICYKMQYEPCFDFLSAQDYRQLPRPDTDVAQGIERMHHLESVAEHYLAQMIKSVTEDEVSTFEPHHQQFYHWAQNTCQKAGKKPPLPLDVLEQNRTVNGAGELTSKVGELLPQILRGKVDALTVLLEDDGIGRHYSDLDALREAYANASVCIDKMAHQNPTLNIIEIGAGTGGATMPILKSLGGGEAGSTPRFGHYTYTDISPGFFEKAKTKFESWGHLMTYQTLDVSADPTAQGFHNDTYDVVIACNVLHATSDISQTMANIRGLLKPGGKVLLIEETVPKARHFPFALLPGWWLANDKFRKDGPLLTVEGWRKVMEENDFSGIDLCVEEYPGAPFQSGCLMTSTANTPATGPTNAGDIVILGINSIGTLSSLGLEYGLRKMTGVDPITATDPDDVDVTGKWCIFLGGMDRSILSHLTEQKFQTLQRLLSRARGLLWVVRHTKTDLESLGANMAIGLARTVRSETGLQFATLDLGERETMSDALAVRHMLKVFSGVFCQKSQLAQNDWEFVVRNGKVCVPRLVDNNALNLSVQQETPDAPPQMQPFKQDRALRLAVGDGKGLDELYFTDDFSRNGPLPDDHIEIQVHSTGLNFRDVLMAMGQLQGDRLGQECSGVVTQVGAAVSDFRIGDRVCAMAPGSLSTFTRCPASGSWIIPDNMPFEIAASIPAVFCTAYYSLIDLGRLIRDESILIHAAAGGVGQAAIIIAQSVGANIFATVGSIEKKNFLMDTYKLKEEHIFFSRDMSFAQGIQQATGGQGVDVALNSLSGDALQATFECVAPFGRFIELGKRDITTNSRLEMAHFNKNISFASVDLGMVREKRPQLTKRLLRDAFKLFVNTNAQSRWSVTTLPISDIEIGFRALQGGQVIGKMVVQVTDDSMVKVHPARRDDNLLRPDASYVIVGGTGGIGLDIASWLPEKGAKNLILVSRGGIKTEKAEQTIRDLSRQGVNVEVCRCDVADKQSVDQNLVPLLARMPPTRGVVYGAMVLRDTLFEKLSFADYQTVMMPRVNGIWNVQRSLISTNGSVDFFVSLSSAASFVGNMGQSPYAASGTFMAALAHYPETAKMRCSTIDLPIVRGVGYLSDDQKREAISKQLGTESVDSTDIRGLVTAAIRNEFDRLCEGHCVVGFEAVKSTPASEQPFWVNDSKLSHLLRLSTLAGTGASAKSAQNGTEISPALAIRQSKTREEAEVIAGTAVLNKISSILMRPMEDLDPAAPISVYGLDSLVAIEIRNWITRELEANLQILEILTSESVPVLAEIILKKSAILTPDLKAEWGLDVAEGRTGQE